ISEPVGRNTAPCIVLAALAIARVDPSATMLVLPADHVISPASEFRNTLRSCAAVAEKTGRLVTIGISPRGPATGYGYIKRGIKPVISGPRQFWQVERFIEKPDLARARRLVRSPRYTWNSGMFVWTVAAFLSSAEEHLPAIVKGLAPYRNLPARRLGSFLREVYPRLPSVSVDYGLMEKARGVLVTGASFSWDDVGSWDALAAHLPAAPGPGGNRCRGSFLGHDAAGCLSFSTGPLVALEGVRDLVVVATGDAVLVCPRGRSQEVREIVAGLKKAGKTDLL
ncbi:MAG TPA: sugar phosphate nucleotidyltransferase, partial [bacterium]|nr:sugar phosphate nucleotidyltransferase [bacterium]